VPAAAAPKSPLRRSLAHFQPQANEFSSDVVQRLAHRRPDLDLGQVELGLHLLTDCGLSGRDDIRRRATEFRVCRSMI
jgi:hypothetical protein